MLGLGAYALCVVVCCFSFLGLASGWYWPFFYFDQPRVHYAIFLYVGGAALLVRKRWLLAVPVLAALLLNLYLLYPCARIRTVSATPATTPLAVLHANLGKQPLVPDELVRFIKDSEADLLLFQEATPAFLERARQDIPAFQIVIAEPRADTKGVAVLAARDLPEGCAIEDARLERLGPESGGRPLAVIELRWDGVPVRLLSFHCIRPSAAKKLSVHGAEYTALASWFSGDPARPALAIGDFNATPWSQRVRKAVHEAGLPIHQQALGLAPSWPCGPLLPFGIPIDLCLHNAHARVLEKRLGPDIGSDHRPLYCVISPP